MEKLLTIKEVSEVLQINERTIHRLIQAKKIPATKVGNQWRFHPALLETWFLNGGEEATFSHAVEESWQQDEEFQLFTRTRTLLDLERPDAASVIEALVNTLADTGHLLQKSIFLQAILEREETSTTGVGKGVAMPHAWHPINDLFRVPLVVCARLCKPVDFHSIDGVPVDLVFLLCAPRNRKHLELLATMSSLIRNEETLQRLREAHDPAEFVLILNERNLTSV